MTNAIPLEFLPHAFCLRWDPVLLTAYATGNALIALAYFTIPLAILRFVRARTDIEFRYMHWLFGLFIAFCGITHVLHVATIWWPLYRLAAAVDMMTAIVSMVAAVMVWKLLPVLVNMPSVKQLQNLNDNLLESSLRLRKSEERLRKLGDNLPSSYLYEFTLENGKARFLHLSSGVERLHGVTVERALEDAELVFGQINSETRVEMGEREQASARNMEDFEYEAPFTRLDGENRWLHLHSRPRKREDGQVIWDGLATDITDRHLLESEVNRLAMAMEQNPTAIFITDRRGQLEYVNPAFTKLSGYQFYEAYARSDRELIASELTEEEFREVLKLLASGRMWTRLLQNRHKDGSLHWEQVTASPIFDAAGTVTHYVFDKVDVNERENMLRQLGLASKVFNNSSEAIIVTDANNRIVSVNPAFSRITGFDASEVLGLDPKVLSSGRHDTEFYRTLWNDLQSRGEWSGEIWNRRKDGTVFPEWLSITVVRDEQGRLLNYVSIFSDITQRKASEEKINYLAHYDPLTGLPNRALLNDRVQVALAGAQRKHINMSLLFLDLDRFKNVNDTLGHQIGDELLKRVAQRLTNLLREEDTISRVGGDEFIVLMPDTDANGATHVARKMLQSIDQPFSIDQHEISIGLSIGVAIYPDNGTDFNALSQAADTALYGAKSGGRNNFRFFTNDMQERTTRFMRIENALRRAIKDNELVLFYQPQYDITGQRVVGAEALLRWNSAELGPVSPGVFIPVAEESGLIKEIGSFVLETAVRQQAGWRKAGIAVPPVAVNLSLAQFRNVSLISEVRDLLEKYELPAELLELELTESMAMESSDVVIQTLDHLNALGLRLSIDDFGTGYSSLSYLKRFHVHKLKIDQSFVRDITVDPEDEAIVSAIINIAKSLKFNVIAEGVETAEQLAILRSYGCEEIQGYYFSKPVPAEEYLAKLK